MRSDPLVIIPSRDFKKRFSKCQEKYRLFSDFFGKSAKNCSKKAIPAPPGPGASFQSPLINILQANIGEKGSPVKKINIL